MEKIFFKIIGLVLFFFSAVCIYYLGSMVIAMFQLPINTTVGVLMILWGILILIYGLIGIGAAIYAGIKILKF